ncbi:MAG TPA: hypothetical protein VNK95_21630 [Caldilineaceae bacterium]|nr:hypothetical protein [Caldilineaceae bacterium]
MTTFNRIVAILVWLLLAALIAIVAVIPIQVVEWARLQLEQAESLLRAWQESDPNNFLIGQIAAGVVGLVVFGLLIGLEIWSGQRRGVRIRTVQGGSAELDTASISRRLSWQLDQLAEIISVVPIVKSKGGSVDIKLEIEAAPDVDVPMKTDEVVEVTRDLIEQDMGLKLGRLDVHMRYAPMDPEWVP